MSPPFRVPSASPPPFRRRAGQVAVMDSGLAAALAVAALAGLFAVYFSLRSSAATTDDYAVLVAVVHEVESASRHYPSYDGIDTAFVIGRGHLPAKMVNAGRITLGSDGLVTVTPAASPASSFILSATGVALARCVKLSLTPIDDRQTGVAVNGVPLGATPAVPPVEAACRMADPAVISWTLG